MNYTKIYLSVLFQKMLKTVNNLNKRETGLVLQN
jgi:hypothetical protein